MTGIEPYREAQPDDSPAYTTTCPEGLYNPVADVLRRCVATHDEYRWDAVHETEDGVRWQHAPIDEDPRWTPPF